MMRSSLFEGLNATTLKDSSSSPNWEKFYSGEWKYDVQVSRKRSR
jgi:hypothetical protein